MNKNISEEESWLGNEEIPYDECPRCGEWKFRKKKIYGTKIVSGGFLGRDYPTTDFDDVTIIKRCKNCKYTEEVERS